MHFKEDRARPPSDFGIMYPNSTCWRNLDKNWSHRANLGENGGQSFKGCNKEKCQL